MSDTPTNDKLLLKLLEEAEFESPEWESISEAISEVSGLKLRLEGVLAAKEATDRALYHMQFVRLEEVLNKFCNLRDWVREKGLDLPPHLI